MFESPGIRLKDRAICHLAVFRWAPVHVLHPVKKIAELPISFILNQDYALLLCKLLLR